MHLPSVVIKNKTYIDIDLDQEWCEEYQSKTSEGEASNWVEARVAERYVISEVCPFAAVTPFKLIVCMYAACKCLS